MIKNLNDLLSAIVLLALLIYSIRIFAWSFFKRDDNYGNKVNRWQLIKDYIDNEEE